MKRLISTAVLIFGWALTTWAVPPATLTSVHQIRALSNAEASLGLPVAFEATVTYSHTSSYTLFVQDGNLGIYILPKTDAEWAPGDRVLIQGKTKDSFHPIVISENITLIHHGVLPMPVPATFDELIRGQRDCLLVTLRGVVRAADKKSGPYHTVGANLQLLTDGGYTQVSVFNLSGGELEGLLDADVEITGVAGGLFDGKMQAHGVVISASSLADIKILKPPNTSPWSLPLTPMGQVIAGYHVTDRTQRVRVHGTITFYQPGTAVVLQNGASSLWISTWTIQPMKVGDVVDATGFPEAHNGFLALTRGEIEDSHAQATIIPLPTTRNELSASQHIIDLVSLEARVVTQARGSTQDTYELTADGQLFMAVYRHPSPPEELPPMKQIPIGSMVRVTGICITEDANPFDSDVGFDILMRSFNDITVVAPPSPLNIRNLSIIVGLLIVVVLVVLARGWTLERRVRRQTVAMSARAEAKAELERWRSGILEDINGSHPLADILEKITKMVSFGLKGAPCWCKIAEGENLGNCPPDTTNLRIVSEVIAARSGQSPGTIFVALDPLHPLDDGETEALAMGARLAALAIKTRRLYSDLRRRSEFDLLTEIHNRFSLEKCLEAQIEEANAVAGIFGLIYIDLDRFKQVNDRYGHHVGDLYLQEAARRMKRQLRSGDILARLGGDEFAAMVSVVRSRAEVEAIQDRVEHCFDDPFVVGGYLLNGAASVGLALYPEDGTTIDNLLNAADAAMYVVKGIHSAASSEFAGHKKSVAEAQNCV